MWVLVTGGAGFIGSHLVHALLARGDRVRVLDDLSTGTLANLAAALPSIEFLRGSIEDASLVRRAVEGVDAILHEAAVVSVPASVEDPRHAEAVNSAGTLELLLAAADAGVTRIVQASSCAVYGDSVPEGGSPEDCIARREDQAPRPASPYAATKLAAEAHAAALSATHGLRAISLRYFNVYGARQSAQSAYAAVVPRFAECLARGDAPVIFGDGGQTRDFCHVDDVVAANLLALAAPSAHAGRAFNVGSGRSTGILELLHAMGRVLKTEAKAHHAPVRAGDLRHSLADPTQATDALGFTATVTLDEGLRRTLLRG